MNFNERENRFNDLELEKSINRSEKSDSSFQKELIFSHEFENAIPSGIAVIDETGKQVYVNRSFCRMVGWEKEELLGINAPFVYWDKRDIENIKNAFRQTMDNNSGSGGYDLLFSHKSGRSIPVNVTIAPIKLENNITYFLANIIDISKRKKTEEDLLKSQSLLAEIGRAHV